MPNQDKTMFEKLTEFLMGRGALEKAAGTASKPAAVSPPNDPDYVKKAVAETMKRKAERDKMNLAPAAAKALAMPPKARVHADKRVP